MGKFMIRLSDGAISKRYKDDNGYLHIPNNPIAKAGVFDYLKKEVDSTSQEDADEIVKVCRTFDDLQQNKDLFSKMPIVLGHQWVGEEIDKVAGAIGEIITAQEPYLYADLIIYSKELIEAIENKHIIELSPAYQADILSKGGEYNGEPYQYEQKLKQVNHLAVVENGRSGKDLRLQDEKIKNKGDKMAIQKIADALATMLKKLKDEEGVEPQKQEDDKRELIRKIMALAAQPDTDFEGGEEEKIEAISKLAESLAYDKVQDEEGEEPKDEPKKTEDEDDDDKGEEAVVEKIADSLSKIIDSKIAGLKTEMKRQQDSTSTAYAEVSKVVGEFNSQGMDANAMYAHGYKCLAGRVLDSGIDAQSAFRVKAGEAQPKFEAKKVQDSSEMSEAHKAILANIK